MTSRLSLGQRKSKLEKIIINSFKKWRKSWNTKIRVYKSVKGLFQCKCMYIYNKLCNIREMYGMGGAFDDNNILLSYVNEKSCVATECNT